MLIANNATYKLFVSDYQKQNSLLQTSMGKLASGQRMLTPGEAPADLGISERFRAQMRNSAEAGRVIQNGINMFSSSDAWLQQIQNMLGRMSELAISASDGSKNADDRNNLDLEFQQLKSEISRVSEAGKYNGLQVNGNTALAVYDFVNNTVVYTQGDGTDKRDIGINMSPGGSSQNGIDYNFVATSNANGNFVGDFMFTEDGQSMVYVGQKAGATSGKFEFMKLDLASDTLTTTDDQVTYDMGEEFRTQMKLNMDETGRIWTAQANDANTADQNGGFKISLLDHNSMQLDTGGTKESAWAGGVVTASGYNEFTVHDDFMYYMKTGDKVFADDSNALAYNATANNVYDNEIVSLANTIEKEDVMVSWTGTAANTQLIGNGITGSYLSLGVKADLTFGTVAATDTMVVGGANQATIALSNIDIQGLAENTTLQSLYDAGTPPPDIMVYHTTADTQSLLTHTAGLGGSGQWDFNNGNLRVELGAAVATTDTFTIVVKNLEKGNVIAIDSTEALSAGSVALNYRTKYDYVRQNLFDNGEVQVIAEDVQMTNETNQAAKFADPDFLNPIVPTGLAKSANIEMSTYAVSKDGLFLAWESGNGEISVMNSLSQKSSTILVGGTTDGLNQNTVNAIGFDGNNNLYWTNTGSPDNKNTITKVSITLADQPELGDQVTVRNENVGRLGTDNFETAPTNLIEQGFGMSLKGGSPGSNYLFQVGPDSGMDVEFQVANVELVTLGLSRLDVKSYGGAQKSVEAIDVAIDRVANERAIIGSEVSRLNFTFAANSSYNNNISQAEARIRDVDFAEESAKMAQAQVMAQTSTAILAQMNTSLQSILRLLQ